MRPGASPADVAAAQKALGQALPADLAGLYQLCDGQVDWMDLPDAEDAGEESGWMGGLFGDEWCFDPLSELLSNWRGWKDVYDSHTPEQRAQDFDDMVEVRDGDPVQSVYTTPDWIPFANEGSGEHLAVDLSPLPGGTVGQIITFGADGDERHVVASGIVPFLELCRERLGAVDVSEADDRVLLYPADH